VEQVYWVIDGLLAGRPGPVEAPWDARALRAAGFRTIVSLNSEPDPTEIADAALLHYSLSQPAILPVSKPLQDMMLHGLTEVLDVLHAEVDAGRMTLVHCHSGKDRTGLVLAAFLIRHRGLDVEQALDRVRAANPIAMSAPGYEATLRRFAEKEQQRSNGDA
jgi:protein-tyrosine phosphatase